LREGYHRAMKTYRGSFLAALTVAALTVSVSAHAAENLSEADKTFVDGAWNWTRGQIAVSQAAHPNLTEVLLQNFARTIVASYTPAVTELKNLLVRKGVNLPESGIEVSRWEKTKDKEFDQKTYDRDYLEKIIRDHEDAIERFTRAAAKSDDADIQAFAKKTLSTLETNLTQGQGLRTSLK
jgi:putative membrane protein